MALWTFLRKLARSAGNLRMIAFSVGIGLLTALFAAAFFQSLEWFTHVCFVQGARVPLLAPAGEHVFDGAPTGAPRTWLFFVLPALGGLVSGLLVTRFAPEAEGHGTDAMSEAFHRKRGLIRTRVPFVKALATIATLGTGGSAGREGPIAQIGAGLGSWAGQKLGVTARERRILLLAGTAAGLGAIFRSPLGGALTAVEVLYSEDFESEALLPSIISSVTAYATFTAIFGKARIFAIPQGFAFHNALELPFYGILGLVCIPAGILYIKLFYGVRDRLFRPLSILPALKPVLGGLGVGLIGLLLPQSYGSGWGQIQLALYGKVGIGLMLVLAFGKMLATSLTIGSGGSGGVFGPTLFIGGMLGGALGLAAHALFPDIVTQPGAYVLVGMAAFFAGVANAPLGVLLMVCEMTGGYDLIEPLLLVSALALLFTRRYSIYENQVQDRFHSDAHLADRTVNLLSDTTRGQNLRQEPLGGMGKPGDRPAPGNRKACPCEVEISVAEVFRPDPGVHVLRDDTTLAEVRQAFVDTEDVEFPVRHKDSHLCGILQMNVVRPVLFDDALDPVLIVADFMSPLRVTSPDDSLYRTMRIMNDSGYNTLAVVDSNHPDRVLGVLHQNEVHSAYRRRLSRMGELAGERLDVEQTPLDRPSSRTTISTARAWSRGLVPVRVRTGVG